MSRRLTAGIAALLLLAGSSAQADIKGKAIRIGVLTDMTGIFATAMGPGSVEAARMAAEEFGGNINGRPIEILQADHQNKPDIAVAVARRWFEQDGVQAIADGGSSGAALGVQELVRSNGRIFLISGAGANQLTDEACAPTSVQWTHDAYSTATAVVSGVMQTSKEPWFFITGDYAFGHSVEATARARIAALGGTVAGSVKAQLGTPDYGSFLLQAQASGAKILALNVAGDNATAIKQAEEFGLAAQGMKIVPMSFQNVDIESIGLKATQGDLIVTSFFEDASPAARRFSDAFYARRKAMPSQIQAGVYSAVRHYLQAVKDADSDDGATVMAKMKSTPVADAYADHGRIRDDQRMVHDLYLVQVKTPAESKGPWDFVKLVTKIAPDQAFRPLDRSKCSLVGK
ncbi:ABC transporter substrate-binding protein [Bradyrhizobium sp. 83002]|uniref:ABC transporter substrate-binding protein n=1 Tax=Bradyrhizobium aeschynomenes TaxID=2734909 RepID=UPI0015551D5D|nr:ABC transporter substrate-binding protein [Bradyrhizobium aeschynomenes]NPU11213.1 ABC transporter substrate-binding protein [Bradyrhizobium aeschynomenes]NPV21876.1 ABC transporter substrate-binding protein [Bradyrhizobium aeschynomenes]